MNVNQVRKGYANLSTLQRLALFDNAVGRDDDSEAAAIAAVSPRKDLSQTDFAETYFDISRIRLSGLVFRLGCVVRFAFLLHAALRPNNGDSKFESLESIFDEIKLVAYFYVRETDSWKTVNDEMGLRPDFDRSIGQLPISSDFMEELDSIMRATAFTESEAGAYLLQQHGTREIKTAERESAVYRAILGLRRV
jgi:hypothetical protein